MKTPHVESLEELVFSNRNKLYGAYNLRKKYGRHLLVSFLSGLFLICSVISFPLIASYLHRELQSQHGYGNGVYEPINPIVEEPLPPPPPPPPIEPVSNERLSFKQPVVVDEETETGLMSQAELENRPVVPPAGDVIEIAPDKETPGVIEQPVAPPAPLLIVEIMPEFPGGVEALFRFLADNLTYPAEAREAGITGKVFVDFIVETDGSISHVEIVRGIGAGCDEEALRVVKMMPPWSPGKQSGIPVRVKYNLPVKFTLR